MLMRFAIAGLAMTLVAAAAYAVAPVKAVPTGPQSSNTTVVEKNRMWPVKGLITVEPCSLRACQEV